MSALNDFIAYCISEYRCPGKGTIRYIIEKICKMQN